MKILNIPELKFLKVAIDKHPNNNHRLEFLEKTNAVASLVINFDETQTLLVKQYRPGTGTDVYEVPAGLIDEGELPIEALYREIREETGYVKENYTFLYDSKDGVTVSPGYTTEVLYLYVIKLNSNNIIPKELELDLSEELENVWVDLDKVEDYTNDMKTLYCLYRYMLLNK